MNYLKIKSLKEIYNAFIHWSGILAFGYSVDIFE